MPVARYRARPVRPADLGRPPPIPDGSWAESGGNEALPPDAERLRRLGERLFQEHPAQIERSMFKVLRDEAAPSRYGLWRTSASVGGLVWVELPGGVFPAFTCSTCHSSAGAEGTLREGVPNHRLDFGKAKDHYTGARSLYSTWGPGRVDLAADGQDNPVVIGDVRAVRFQTHLHRTANVKNLLPALAVRVETGLITAHRQEVRPTPVDAYALAYYLWRLGESLPAPPAAGDAGAAVFAERCGRCHQGPGLSGPPVAASSIASPTAHAERSQGHGHPAVHVAPRSLGPAGTAPWGLRDRHRRAAVSRAQDRWAFLRARPRRSRAPSAHRPPPPALDRQPV